MLLSDYNYHLPKEAIAHVPPTIRGQAKLLVLDRSTGDIEDKNYSDVADYLTAGDVVVLNNTKVIKARLFAEDESGKTIELILLEKHNRTTNHHQNVLYRGTLRLGQKLSIHNNVVEVTAVRGDGIATIRSDSNLDDLAERVGNVPLPPYLKRDATKEDVFRYQTEFAEHNGSVAAPTASLNMTKALIQQLESKGVKVCYLTLHVGLGTFLPIRTDKLEDHNMHSEWYSIPKETVTAIQTAKQLGKHITAIGTTVARTLEYCADSILHTDQALTGEADIFIYPGYKFTLIDQLVTNFHAPKSTVLMLVAAFAGWPNLLAAYEHALSSDYRFLSYGDSMLIH